MASSNLKRYVSLRAKLYLLIGGIVAMVTAIISTRNLYESKMMLENQISQRTLNIAEMSLKALEFQVELWQSQIKQILKAIARSIPKEADLFARKLIQTSDSLISIQIIKQFANKPPETLTKYTSPSGLAQLLTKSQLSHDQLAATIEQNNLQWVKQQEKKHDYAPTSITPFSSGSDLPLLSIMIPARATDGSILWGILTIHQETLARFVSVDERAHGFVVNKDREFILADSLQFKRLGIFDLAVSGAMPIGSKNYKLPRYGPHIGAFAWSQTYSFAVVYIRNIKDAIHQIHLELLKTIIITIIVLIVSFIISYYSAVTLTSKLDALTELTQIIASGDFSKRIFLKSNDEIGVLETSINHMAGQINQLLYIRVEAAKREKELLTAKAVQDTFFHKGSVTSGRLNISGSFVSADECGGDWWNCLPMSDDIDLVCMADAAGHGLPAALVTAMAYSFFQTFSHINRQAEGGPCMPHHLLEKLNEVFWDAGFGKTTMTMFLAFINNRTGEVFYANAGHNFPLIFPRNTIDSRIKGTQKTHSLHSHSFPIVSKGIPLGYQAASKYQTKALQLKEGDRICLYTDGIIECRNPQDKMWGKKNFLTTLNHLREEQIEDVVKKTIANAFEFFAHRPIDDDITVVMVEYL